MDEKFYLTQFQQAAAKLDKELLHKKNLEVETGVWLDSVVLKLHKRHWANNPDAKPQTGAGIFFSVWLGNDDLKSNKLCYNIHALKLRQLNGYTITSRDFAADFRQQFKKFEHNWPNVSVNFGPLTLMEGWQTIDLKSTEEDVFNIAQKFFEIDSLIDSLLSHRKK
jgi:hypothetical protein